jgi:hypothetical protein
MDVGHGGRKGERSRSTTLPEEKPVSTRPLLAATAAASALLLGATAGSPALAATPSAPKGVGTSTVSLLDLVAGGHELAVGGVSLVSDTVNGSALAKATITPLVADGTAYGKQEVTPSNSPVTVPAVTSPAAIAGIVSVTTPAITASATSGPSSTAGIPSLGSLSVLRIPVSLSGDVTVSSAVSSAGALAQKSVTVSDLSLPSIGAILAALGLDVTKLPTGTLSELIGELGLTNAAIDTAQAAVDAAQSQVDVAAAAVADAQAALTAANSANTAAQAAVAPALATLEGLLDQVSATTTALYPGADTVLGYAGLGSAGTAVVELDAPGTAAAFIAYTDAVTAASAAAAQVAAAQAALDAAQAQLATLSDALADAVAVVDGLAATLLNGTPLVSLDSLTVGTTAKSSSGTLAGQTAEISGGTIKGLKVLGTDVLATALGSTQVDLLALAGAKLASVTAAVDEVTGALSSVLSTVPGLPALQIPAPEVQLLTRTTKKWVEGGYGRAMTAVQALSIALPAVTIPSAVALPSAAALPALTGVTQTAGQLVSAPISFALLTVADQSAFAPTALPGTGGRLTQQPPLAQTGLPVGLAALALLLVGAGVIAHRRRAVPVEA